MKKIIITGASSFIGYRLCQKYAQCGDLVYAIVRQGCRNKSSIADLDNVKLIYLNMDEYRKITELIDDNCDIAFSLAWNGTRGEARSDKSLQNENYIYSMDALECFFSLGCSTIVTAGSQAEYGPQCGEQKVIETNICHPNTEYGKYKLLFFEEALKKCSEKGVRLIEPRFFSLYGVDDSEKTMVISMIRNMIQNIPCELTQCIQLWDFLNVDDAIEGLVKLVNTSEAEGIFNFGSGEVHELKDYIEIMYEVTESHSELRYGCIPYPQTGIVHTNPSIDKLCRLTGWKPTISFYDGIKNVVNFQKALLQKGKG